MGDDREYQCRELRSPDGIANKIIFTRQYPGNEFLSFLIVEGDTDKNFYKTFVDTNKCQINVAYNKSSAIQVLSILEKDNFPGVLAIVDADFDALEGTFPTNQNVLFTDTHDLETMIMRSPALAKVLNEIGSEEKITHIVQKTQKDMHTILLESCIPIGYLRWLSLQKKLSLKFEDLNFKDFINKETLAINLQSLIQAVKNKSGKHDIVDKQLTAEMQNMKSDTHDPWHICCGHDLVYVLAFGLRKTIGTYNVGVDVLETELRLAFERSHFYTTQLFLSIQQWEIDNEPFVILEREG